MFLNNKYTRCYYSLIAKRKETPFNGYVENHHIIPRSMGGSNDVDNLVGLSAREHYIAHLLLARMTTGPIQHKMLKAAWLMACPTRKERDYQVNSRIYESLRVAHSSLNADPTRRAKTSASMKTYQATNPWTPERREKQRLLTIEKMQAAGKWNKGQKKRAASHDVTLSGPKDTTL